MATGLPKSNIYRTHQEGARATGDALVFTRVTGEDHWAPNKLDEDVDETTYLEKYQTPTEDYFSVTGYGMRAKELLDTLHDSRFDRDVTAWLKQNRLVNLGHTGITNQTALIDTRHKNRYNATFQFSGSRITEFVMQKVRVVTLDGFVNDIPSRVELDSVPPEENGD